MDNQVLSPSHVGWVIFAGYLLVIGILAFAILLLKKIIPGFTPDKEEKLYKAGDPCPYCADGVLEIEYVEANPQKIQIGAYILKCDYCHLCVTPIQNTDDL